MTQRIFDRENEKDMADLWDIVPENIVKIRKAYKSEEGYFINFYDSEYTEGFYETAFLIIDWHDKTEITRPIQECTEQDIGKICVFYDRFDETDDEPDVYAVLHKIENQDKNTWFYTDTGSYYAHCRRLTKQEIEELI